MAASKNSSVSRAKAQQQLSTAPIFRAKAPLRVSFAGGGTDVSPFPEQEGGVVLSATINRFAHGMLRPRADGRIRVESLDLGVALEYGAEDQLEFDGELDLAKSTIARVAGLGEPLGADVFLNSSAPPGSGLGGSSSLVVSLIGLLRDYQKLALTDYEIAQLAWEVERIDLGLRGGLQDHYASTFGGFNFIEFGAERVIVNPLRVSRSTLLELESNLVLCFTGATRAGDHIIADQTERYEKSDSEALDGLRQQKVLAVKLKDRLLRGELTEFGGLLDEAWYAKQKMSPLIATPTITKAYSAAKEAGALGGKVTGAGGGGFMLFYCRPGTRHKVVAALTDMGIEETEFGFEEHGLQTWTHVER